MIPRFVWLGEKWLDPFVSDLDTNLPRRVFHSSGDASSAEMMSGRLQRCWGKWGVRRVIERRREGCAPGLIPTRRVRGSGACSGSRRDPDGPRCRPSCIRRIARESNTYQDKSPYLYRNMLWSRYNQDTR